MGTELLTPTNNPRAAIVIAALNDWNRDLHDDDREEKYGEMAKSPFKFYRGTNHLFWRDFAGDARLSVFGGFDERTWLQGDMHIKNFGAFGNDDDVVVYDINDFDESVIADYQYDVWRMAVSIVLAAQEQGDLTAKQQEEVVEVFALNYLEAGATYCLNGGEHVTVFDRSNTFGRLNNLLKKVEKKNTREDMLRDWTVGREFLEIPGEMSKIPEVLRAEIASGIERYQQETLAKLPKGADDSYFEVRDIARRLGAGTGSLGMPRYYVLIRGVDDKPKTDRILDVKRQSRPTAYQFLSDDDLHAYHFFTREMPGQDAIWHAAAYRAMARDTDDHLGWMELSDGFYSVRELSYCKESIDLKDLDSKKRFSDMAKQWGMILATAHSRALTDFDDDFPEFDVRKLLFRQEGSQKRVFKCRIAKRTQDKQDEFAQLAKEIAFDYAHQVTADWRSFTSAKRG